MLEMVDRFGVPAVLGRPVSALELRDMLRAERVSQAYRDYKKTPDQASWSASFPQIAQELFAAMKASNG